MFKEIPHLSSISQIAAKHDLKVWLVGGFLRDVYLKKHKDLIDFDFCVEKNTFTLVKEFSKKIKSKFIILDKTQESLRVILKKDNKHYTYDFTRMRGKDLREDLSLRDFSFNALAVDLESKKYRLIDYFSGREDLKKGLIRVVRDEVIAQDPLRILRGFSFVANYGFSIEAKTLRLFAKSKHLIKKSSKERINEELFKILGSENSYQIIGQMDKIGLIDQIIPYIDKTRGLGQGRYHHLPVWAHSKEALRQFELMYKNKLAKNKDTVDYLNEELAQNRKRLQIIKLACLLHDIGKPLAKKKLKKKTIFHTHEKIGRDLAHNAAKALRLSLREREVLKKLIFWHLRPGYLADQIKPTHRAIYRFFRDTKEEGVAVILLSLADWRATCGPLTDPVKRKRHEKIMLNLVSKYFSESRKKPLPKTIDGYDIMKKFKLTPGPFIGAILKKIKEEQALGRVVDKTDAYRVAKNILNKSKSRGGLSVEDNPPQKRSKK